MVTNKDYCLQYSDNLKCFRIYTVLNAVLYNLSRARLHKPHDWHMLYIGTEKECEKLREGFMPLIDDTPF